MDDIVSLETTGKNNIAVATFNAASISDVEAIAAASNLIRDFVDQNRPSRLIFDFGAVKFFSSQVLGLLLEIRSRLEAHNGQVLISAIDPRLHRVFKITNLDKIFKFFPDKQSAINATSTG